MNLIKAVAVLFVVVAACGPGSAPDDDERLHVVAAFYPIADAATRIGGGSVVVTNVTPPGAEPHDVELTTAVRDALIEADVMIHIAGFQPALDDALFDIEGRVVDLAAGDDPHIWLDPVVWVDAVAEINEAIKDVRIGADEGFDVRLRTYQDEIRDLDEAFEEGLADCERDLIVTAHDAFGRLAQRYGLRVESIAGISPEAEPNPKRLAELADVVEREGVTTIFTEELVSPEVAEALANEAGVDTAILDPIESEPEGGYFGAMQRNLAALRTALRCR